MANETSPIYHAQVDASEDEEELDNPAIYLAQAATAEWDNKKDLHVGPLDHRQQQEFQTLIQNNYDVCAKSQTDIGRTNLIQHTIPTGDARPVAKSLTNATQRTSSSCGRKLQKCYNRD